MGMTASALYRYVDGHAALLDRLTASFFDELVGELRCAVPAVAPGLVTVETVQVDLLAASRAFRRWSVAHPREFSLMFGPHEQLTAECPQAHEAGERFGMVFVGLSTRALAGPRPGGDGTLFSPLPPPVAELFARCWVRMLGLVMVEVAGEYGREYLPLDPERVFEAEMTSCAEAMGECLRSVRPPAGAH
jgi:hypothetical protein